VNVECPLSISDSSSNLAAARVYIYDRNTTADVSCTQQKTDEGGTAIYSNYQQTFGSQAGLYTVTYASPVSPVAFGGWWRFACSIPAVESGQFSHIASFVISSN